MKHALRTHLWRALACAGLALTTTCASAQSDTESELARRLDALAAELAAVKAQLAVLQQQRAAPVAAGTTTAPPPVAASPTARYEAQPATVLSSYGEINHNRPTRGDAIARADLRRFVLGFQHRFDERTKVVAELEVEHAVTSASDAGEVALEQAYVEREFAPGISWRAGLFLVPMGLLNENHEPPAFYGVERNFVETAIIPSTWREGGVQLVRSFDNGLTLQGGVATSFDLGKWDASASEGRDSPLGAVHQELSLAKAQDLALFGAANWRGVPGLLVGASVFSGKATQTKTGPSARITLSDLHARWMPGRWDFSALIARGSISGTAALNAPLVGNPTLIPERFDGHYLQAAYKLWSRGDEALLPFLRWERFNTARAYAALGQGLTPDAARTERVLTWGANYRVTPGIVVKADVQRFGEKRDSDRVNLGLGWSF
jgi:hypothetical protein